MSRTVTQSRSHAVSVKTSHELVRFDDRKHKLRENSLNVNYAFFVAGMSLILSRYTVDITLCCHEIITI